MRAHLRTIWRLLTHFATGLALNLLVATRIAISECNEVVLVAFAATVLKLYALLLRRVKIVSLQVFQTGPSFLWKRAKLL